jgi:hypothetical protein
MAANVTTTDLEFTRLNNLLSLYTPPVPSNGSGKDPTTIIFCQWMGVGPKSRYVKSFYNHYHTLYPSARIISIRSLTEFFLYTNTSTRRELVKPIVAAIDSDPAPEKRILAHVISNGGTLGFLDACHVYKEQTGNVLPVKALLMDSSPSETNVVQAFNAFSHQLPKGLLWYPGAVLLWMFLAPLALARAVTGYENILDKNWKFLNDWRLVDKDAKRLYVYSDADKLVGADSVEKHAKDAEAKGIDVSLLKEKDTPHVQHMLLDTERYWKTVSDLWTRASS